MGRNQFDAVEVSRWGKIVNAEYDYLGIAYPDATTETYTFKQNGASGTTVCTITIVYTDATKASMSSVTRS